VTETALVGLLAGAFALLWSWGMLKALATLFAESFPLDAPSIVFEVAPNLEIFAYVLGVSLVAGMLSGLAPAMEGSRLSLSSSGRASTSSARGRRLQDLLVTAQVALSLVLLITAGMLIRSSTDTLWAPTGYDTENVIAVELEYPEASEYTAARKIALLQEIRASLAALPGVAAITSAQAPGVGRFKTGAIALDEAGSPERNAQTLLPYTYVQGNYFQILGIPLVLGSGLPTNSEEAELSVILSESAAKYLWPNQSPIGRSLRLGVTDEQSHPARELVATGPEYQIVGVARDKRIVALDALDSRELYLPLPEERLTGRPMLIRSESDPIQVTKAIHEVISSVDPGMTANSASLEEMLRQSPLFVMLSMAAGVALAVGFCGLLLTVMGIYGTVSYIVVLRTREVGIRMAIGAQKHNILGLILSESARPVLVGLCVGVSLAMGTSYVVRRVFYGLIAFDGLALAGVSLLFLAVALLAAYPPARRAMAVDPMVALRYE
jgi:putative ABC transport system permease protein